MTDISSMSHMKTPDDEDGQVRREVEFIQVAGSDTATQTDYESHSVTGRNLCLGNHTAV